MSIKFFSFAKQSGKIWALLKPEMSSMIVASVFMGITAITTALYAYLVGPLIRSLFLQTPEVVSEESAYSSLNFLSDIADRLSNTPPFLIGMLVIFVATIKGGAFFGQRLLIVKAGQKILHNLRIEMYRGILKMNPLSEKAKNTGELISRFTVDAQVVESAVTGGAMGLIGNALQMIVLIALALSLSGELGFIGLIALGPIVIAISKLGRVLRKRQGTFYDSYSIMSKTLEESCRALPVVSSFNVGEMAKERFSEKSDNIRKSAISAYIIAIISSPVNEVLGAGALGMTLWYAHMQIQAGHLTAEAFISFFTALFLLYRPVKGFGRSVHAVITGLAALDKLEPILNPENKFETEQTNSDKIELNDISAEYKADTPVLNNISFKVNNGEKLAIIGQSGSGKTTLLNLLAGYLKPSDGTIVSTRPVAIVPQDIFLFDDTIAMNVLCGRPDASTEDVKKALFDAGADSFVDELDGGIEYRVGINGSRLSIGQAQRICLARALISGYDFYLLDEVTSNLDEETEREVLKRLNGCFEDKTVIIITHRPEAAKWANSVISIKDGNIINRGSFEDIKSGALEAGAIFNDNQA